MRADSSIDSSRRGKFGTNIVGLPNDDGSERLEQSGVDHRRRSCLGAMVGTGVSLLAASLLAGPISAAETGAPVKLRDLYEKDFSFSALARSLEGRRIDVEGYMAPPLKANASFFVLTKRPMATCPFCESEADWPRDILAVYTSRTLDVMPFNVDIVASGVLELGSFKDTTTGFVSRVRLAQASVERV